LVAAAAAAELSVFLQEYVSVAQSYESVGHPDNNRYNSIQQKFPLLQEQVQTKILLPYFSFVFFLFSFGVEWSLFT